MVGKKEKKKNVKQVIDRLLFWSLLQRQLSLVRVFRNNASLGSLEFYLGRSEVEPRASYSASNHSKHQVEKIKVKVDEMLGRF